eukprot:7789410-Pyramimonas_sp.AAC.1
MLNWCILCGQAARRGNLSSAGVIAWIPEARGVAYRLVSLVSRHPLKTQAVHSTLRIIVWLVECPWRLGMCDDDDADADDDSYYDDDDAVVADDDDGDADDDDDGGADADLLMRGDENDAEDEAEADADADADDD